MTSRNLFFKLMKEDLKRKMWAISLAFLSFFFWMPVNTAMNLSNLQQKYERWLTSGTELLDAQTRYQTQLENLIGTAIGMENVLNVVTILVSAIVMALTGFLYLHSRKQVDFYHSVPVRREILFLIKYLNGIWIVLSMYLLNMLMAVGILGAYGLDISLLLSTACTTFIVHAGAYFINYSLMTIAVMLTGNFFISILGGIVLFAWIPAIIALIQGMMYLFFETANFRAVDVNQMMINGSPISAYINLVNDGARLDYQKYGSLLGSVGIMALAGLTMSVISLILYKKRPSESAGKAMAFSITKAPIKMLIVIPTTVAAAILFWQMYYSIPWAVFGFIVGLAVTHAVVEIIYHFEFRKLFVNLHHMAICAVLAIAFIAVFWFDLIGYDSYKPKVSELESASIYVAELQNTQEYGLPRVYNQDTGTYTGWTYYNMSDYVAEHMKVTDYEIISVLANAGILNAKTEKEDRSDQQDVMSKTDGFWSSMEIGYTLKNGTKKYRHYTVNVTELRETFDRLYTMAEYKRGEIPVLSYLPENLTGVYEYRGDYIVETTTDPSLTEKLLLAYQKDMTALTLEERSKETPVTSLRFLTIAEHDYISDISFEKHPNYNGDFKLDDMNVVNFFPVYPSFVHTLTLLEEAGAEPIGPIEADDVLRIEIVGDYYTDEKAYYDAPVSYYREKVYVETASAVPVTVEVENGIRTITLEEDGTEESIANMKLVLDSSFNQRLARLNGLQPLEYGISVHVYMKESNEGRALSNQEYVQYVFDPDKIPQFVRDAYDYDNREFKNVNYGLNIPIEK